MHSWERFIFLYYIIQFVKIILVALPWIIWWYGWGNLLLLIGVSLIISAIFIKERGKRSPPQTQVSHNLPLTPTASYPLIPLLPSFFFISLWPNRFPSIKRGLGGLLGRVKNYYPSSKTNFVKFILVIIGLSLILISWPVSMFQWTTKQEFAANFLNVSLPEFPFKDALITFLVGILPAIIFILWGSFVATRTGVVSGILISIILSVMEFYFLFFLIPPFEGQIYELSYQFVCVIQGGTNCQPPTIPTTPTIPTAQVKKVKESGKPYDYNVKIRNLYLSPKRDNIILIELKNNEKEKRQVLVSFKSDAKSKYQVTAYLSPCETEEGETVKTGKEFCRVTLPENTKEIITLTAVIPPDQIKPLCDKEYPIIKMRPFTQYEDEAHATSEIRFFKIKPTSPYLATSTTSNDEFNFWIEPSITSFVFNDPLNPFKDSIPINFVVEVPEKTLVYISTINLSFSPPLNLISCTNARIEQGSIDDRQSSYLIKLSEGEVEVSKDLGTSPYIFSCNVKPPDESSLRSMPYLTYKIKATMPYRIEKSGKLFKFYVNKRECEQ